MPSVAEDRNVLALSRAEVIDKVRAVDVSFSIDLINTVVDSDLPDTKDGDFACPSTAVIKGWL